VTVSPDHTSVPRWADEPPDVDPTGRSYLVVSTGEAGRAVASRWTAAIASSARPLWAHHDSGESPLALDGLRQELAAARVGTRVMVAAPERDVLDVLRLARAAGAVDAELRAHVTPAGDLRVYCPHCRTDTHARLGVGDTVACEGCRRTLIVYHHVSRLHGAYLGYMVDAEEPAT
jgi:dimethylamine monooxygenase subunit C